MEHREAHELFEYRDGNLFWRTKRGQRALAGAKAGTLDKDGYTVVRTNGKTHKVHRLVFLMHHGYLPIEVEHASRDKSDNRIENLRAADRSGNMHNIGLSAANKSGCKNVSWNKRSAKWQTELKLHNKTKYLGMYEDLELADLVAQEARDLYHGRFACHG